MVLLSKSAKSNLSGMSLAVMHQVCRTVAPWEMMHINQVDHDFLLFSRNRL